MDGKNEELKLLKVVGVKLTSKLRREFADQGHHLTGSLEQSIHGEAFFEGDASTLRGTMLYFGAILNFGVTAARIPFNPGSGYKTSKYITGLINYWKLRGITDEKEAKSAAFATAAKQKGLHGKQGEGMPTSGSYSYSKNGRRKEWIDVVSAAVDEEIDNDIGNGIDRIMERKFQEGNF